MLDLSPHSHPSVYLTPDVPGIGGLIKQRPDDFLVEEVPLYQPCGTGEHIYLFVQKRGLSTQQLVAILARHFRVRESDVGYAGLKDKQAITRQVMSVHTPGKVPEDFPQIRDDRVAVLWSDLHTNKLRRGHLHGNRFSIRVRGVPLRAVFDAKRVLECLDAVGVPNRLGEQRFGALQNNHLIGRALILGDHQAALDLLLGPGSQACLSEANTRARELYAAKQYTEAIAFYGRGSMPERRALAALARGANPRRACDQLRGLSMGFFLSSFQSAVFNAVLDRRLRDGKLGTLIEGDLAWRHEQGAGAGAVFKVDAPTLASAETAERLAAKAISPSGPMWGSEMLRATGETDRTELEALAAMGVTPEHLGPAHAQLGDELRGERRPLRVPLMYAEVDAGGDEHGSYVRCGFELPPGAFATVVMDEVMKVHAPFTPDSPDTSDTPDTPDTSESPDAPPNSAEREPKGGREPKDDEAHP